MKKIKEVKDIADQFPKRQEGKLNIYFHCGENSGVGFYRQFLPAVALRETGLANVLISDFRYGIGDHVEPTIDMLFSIANWADVLVCGRRDQPQYYATYGGIREFFNIPIIMDTDDLVQFVNPENPGYAGYFPGSPAGMMNKYGIHKVFDAITTSTSNLKDFYTRYNPKISVLPNSLDLKEWNKHPRPEHDEIRIGFISSAAHLEGFKIIKAPMFEIMKRHPNVKFYITGAFSSVFEDWPKEYKDRMVLVNWINLEEWPKKFKEMGLDIGLCPLNDTLFNRGKSNLRWLEYSAGGLATVASDVEPYKCIKSGTNGILVREKDEWIDAIDKLVTDEKFRKDIAKNAFETITNNYDIEKNAVLWNNIYKDVVEKYHNFYGKKKKFVKVGKNKFRKLK